MSSPAFEAFLARLYADDDLRSRFLADPTDVARAAGLSAREVEALAAIDRTGLELAGRSYARKRADMAAHRDSRPPLARWLARLRGALRLPGP